MTSWITPKLAVSIDGTYVLQNKSTTRWFDNFAVGLKHLLHVNDPHESMTSAGVAAKLGGIGNRVITD